MKIVIVLLLLLSINIFADENEKGLYEIYYIPLKMEFFEPYLSENELLKEAFYYIREFHSNSIPKIFDFLDARQLTPKDALFEYRIKITDKKSKKYFFIGTENLILYENKVYIDTSNSNLLQNVIDELIFYEKDHESLYDSYEKMKKQKLEKNNNKGKSNKKP